MLRRRRRQAAAPSPAPAERITAAIKSLPLKLTGFSGLMLPLCEDSGLVAAADAGRISIGSLLQYSGGPAALLGWAAQAGRGVGTATRAVLRCDASLTGAARLALHRTLPS